MKSFFLFVMTLLLPSSLITAQTIKIDFKLLESVNHKIPHDLAKASEIKDITILTFPSVNAGAGQEQEIVMYRELHPASVVNQGFSPVPIGQLLAVTPRLVDGKIPFTAILTLSENFGGKAEDERFQTEVLSRVVYFSASQKDGEEGWFDLVEPGPGKKDKKFTVWIRCSLIDLDPDLK